MSCCDEAYGQYMAELSQTEIRDCFYSKMPCGQDGLLYPFHHGRENTLIARSSDQNVASCRPMAV